ncbi:MAG: NAD(P)H-dependent oxidoreductase [Chthoniobacter sp.]|uniref:NADPH-dependent FMN reductase n=1 Tax=Chthoniobacter sp. TaxID=2510640 RepID=UPI0032A43C33
MNQPKIIAFAGSLRVGSFNKKLLAVAADAARTAGAEVTIVDLRDLALPLFDEDLEEAGGLPEGAKKLKALLRASDGMLIASAEYNSSITAALKNAIDWASRAETDDEPPLVAFRGKAAALLATSPGALGGLRGLVTVRSILSNIGVLVLPDQVAIPAAHEAFDESGKLKDERKAKQVAGLAKGLVELTRKLKG